MVIRDVDRAIARRIYQIAVGLVAARETGSISELAQEALDYPRPATIHALLNASRGREWLPSVTDALAQVGIIASEDMLVRDVSAGRLPVVSQYFERDDGESVAEYAARMRDFVRLLSGKVSSIAGLGFDADDVLESLDYVISQPDDEVRARRWDVIENISRRVHSIPDVETLTRIEAYIERVGS